MEVAIRNIFANHVYKFGGRFYRQVKGGPIGLRLTGTVARLVMDKWARVFLQRLQKAGIPLEVFLKYVDDVNLALTVI